MTYSRLPTKASNITRKLPQSNNEKQTPLVPKMKSFLKSLKQSFCALNYCNVFKWISSFQGKCSVLGPFIMVMPVKKVQTNVRMHSMKWWHQNHLSLCLAECNNGKILKLSNYKDVLLILKCAWDFQNMGSETELKVSNYNIHQEILIIGINHTRPTMILCKSTPWSFVTCV